MSSSTTSTSRARVLEQRTRRAAAASLWAGVLAGVFWLVALVDYADSPVSEHLSSTVLVCSVLGIAATCVCAAYAAASFVVGALSDAEQAG